MPRYLRYSLFSNSDEKLRKLREHEFPVVLVVYEELKEKGNKFFKKGKYHEAIDYYTYVLYYLYNYIIIIFL